MSTTFDFTKCLSFIEDTGKKVYNPNFRVIADDHEIIFRLLVYILADKDNCEKYGISLRKGVLLSGPVGCGKTSLMNILRFFLKPENRFVMKTCRDVSFEFIQEGYATIHKYSRHSFKNDTPRIYCFDDLGTENNLKYFGNNCSVMSEILLSRYEFFVSHGMKTHLTTNLNSSDIQETYGIRIRSRLREQFNLIAFSESAKDKRV